MARRKLTDRTIANIKAPAAGRDEYWDSILPGFGLRVTDRDVRTWFVMYRCDTPAGRVQRRFKVGDGKMMTLADARKAARLALEAVASGGDPAADKKATKAAPAEARTFAAVAEKFVERYASGKRSHDEIKRILEKYVKPKWSARAIDSIVKPDVVDLLDDVRDANGPVMARQVHAVVRRLFNWACDRGVIGASPCVRIPSPGEAVERDRVLTDDDLAAVWRAIGKFDDPHAGLFKLLILLGQRRTETAAMRWRDLDLEERTWTLPAETVKTGNVHVVPLPEEAVEIINAQPKLHGDYVFSFTGSKPITGFSVPKKLVDERSGVGNWVWHDLRRTLASGLARLGVGVHVVELVLNHRVGGISSVGRVYQRYEFMSERRTALETWARHVEAIVERKKTAKVVTLSASVR